MSFCFQTSKGSIWEHQENMRMHALTETEGSFQEKIYKHVISFSFLLCLLVFLSQSSETSNRSSGRKNKTCAEGKGPFQGKTKQKKGFPMKNNHFVEREYVLFQQIHQGTPEEAITKRGWVYLWVSEKKCANQKIFGNRNFCANQKIFGIPGK